MASEKMELAYEILFHAACNQYMNTVIDAVSDLFGYPVLFVDEYFHVISMAPDSPVGNDEWDRIWKNKIMDGTEIFNISSDLFSGDQQTTSTHFIHMELQPGREISRMISRLYLDNAVRGYVIVFWSNDNRPKEEDYQLMELALSAIRLRVSTRIRTVPAWNLTLSEKITDLLSIGNDTESVRARLALQALRDSTKPAYFICTALIGDTADQQHFSDFAVRELQQLYRNVICAVWRGSVIVLCTAVPDAAPLTQTRTYREISDFFSRLDMVTGTSNLFTDLSKIYIHYRQAMLSARLAARLGSEQSVSFNELMPLPLFLQALHVESPETFVHPALKEIRKYDAVYGTDYYESLRVYALSMFRRVPAAAKLGITPKALSYRMKQLTRVYPFRLEEKQEQINLICSFLLLDAMGIQPPTVYNDTFSL